MTQMKIKTEENNLQEKLISPRKKEDYFKNRYSGYLKPTASIMGKAQNKKQSEDRMLNLTNLDQRLKDMDRQGIDMQLLIPVPFQAYYAIRNERGHKAIQIINNTLSKVTF